VTPQQAEEGVRRLAEALATVRESAPSSAV
jgi:hypothetical protein